MARSGATSGRARDAHATRPGGSSTHHAIMTGLTFLGTGTVGVGRSKSKVPSFEGAHRRTLSLVPIAMLIALVVASSATPVGRDSLAPMTTTSWAKLRRPGSASSPAIFEGRGARWGLYHAYFLPRSATDRGFEHHHPTDGPGRCHRVGNLQISGHSRGLATRSYARATLTFTVPRPDGRVLDRFLRRSVRARKGRLAGIGHDHHRPRRGRGRLLASRSDGSTGVEAPQRFPPRGTACEDPRDGRRPGRRGALVYASARAARKAPRWNGRHAARGVDLWIPGWAAGMLAAVARRGRRHG